MFFHCCDYQITAVVFLSEIIHCSTHKWYKIQCFMWSPLLPIAIFGRLGKLSMSLQQYSEVMSRAQTIFITFFSCLIPLSCSLDTLFFKTTHKFSIGFRSGLLPGQPRTWIFLLFKKLVTIFDLWHGAPSFIKVVHWCTFMWSFNLWFSNSRYFELFVGVPRGTRNSPAVP